MTHDILRARLLVAAGVFDAVVLPPPGELRKTEWVGWFEQLMRNRLVMGAYRYGPFASKRQSFDYDAADEAIARINRYKKDRNIEHLADAANMCMLEAKYGQHPKKHFAAIDDGKHAKPRR